MDGAISNALERRLRTLGIPGVLGLGIAACGLVMHLAWHRPLQAEIARQESALSRAYPAATYPTTTTPEPDGAMALEAILQQLPGEASIGDQVKALHAIAAKHGVPLRKGGYDLVWETAGRLGRQRMVLHSDAAYPAMRHFLREALAAQPALALDDILFTRRQAGIPSLEATLTFTLLVSRLPDVKQP